MAENKSKILVLVEGAKTDVNLMEHLLNIYGISENHMIVPYCTNIYTLYNEMFRDNKPEEIDLLQLLKEREQDPEKKLVLDERYSDILLIFDLDPQDPAFSSEKIKRMSEYFVESSDMGKLYINYPMVEAFYHMKSIPDPGYNSRYSTMAELIAKKYKKRVNTENRDHDYSKFAISKHECDTVIRQNIEKGFLIAGSNAERELPLPDPGKILSDQLDTIESEQRMLVLCTCAFYIVEYNPKLIEQ